MGSQRNLDVEDRLGDATFLLRIVTRSQEFPEFAESLDLGFGECSVVIADV
jgi:hypothetical protein